MAAATPRRRPARAARIVVTGLSTVGTFAIVTALSAAASTQFGAAADGEGLDDGYVDGDEYVDGSETADVADDETDEAEPVGRRTVVVELHRTVYVDEYGRPVDPFAPPSSTDASSTVPSSSRPPSTTVPKDGPQRAPSTTAAKKKTTKKRTTTTVAKKKTTKKKTTKKKTSTPSCSGSKCG